MRKNIKITICFANINGGKTIKFKKFDYSKLNKNEKNMQKSSEVHTHYKVESGRVSEIQ